MPDDQRDRKAMDYLRRTQWRNEARRWIVLLLIVGAFVVALRYIYTSADHTPAPQRDANRIERPAPTTLPTNAPPVTRAAPN